MAEGVTKVPATFFVVWAHAARERDDRDGARAAFERALDRGPARPAARPHLDDLPDVGCGHLRLARGSPAGGPTVRPAGAVRGRHDVPVRSRRTTRRPPRADARRPDEAEQLLRDAVALCERMDARAFLAMARHDLGELLLPSPEGRRLLEQARAAANELGMPGLTKRAAAAYE